MLSKNKVLFVIFLAFGICTIMVSSAKSADFYTDSEASSSGSGSFSSPFKTIQEGINALKAGDTLHIRGGATLRTYNETPSFPSSGSAGSPITIRGYQNEKVTIATSNSITINKNYITINNLTFDHNNATVDSIKVQANHITFINCEIKNGQREGLQIYSGYSNVLIDNCKIHDFKWLDPRTDAHCVMADLGSTNIRITNSTIYDCSGDGFQLFAETSTDPSSYGKNILIENSIFYTTLGANQENAMDFKGGDNVVVRNNEIYNFTANKAVVFQKGVTNSRFEGNRVHDVVWGMEFRQEGAYIQQNNTASGNEFWNISGQWAMRLDGVENALIYNNTFYNVSNYPIRTESQGVSGDIRNNLFYNCGNPSIGSGFTATYGNNGWFNTSAGSLSGANDTTGSNPLMVDAANHDFRLREGSPAIDKGAFVGNPYNGARPDLGAHEYGNVTMLIPNPPQNLRIE